MLLIECLKEAKMYLTFHIYQLRKDFTENFEKFLGGYPHFGPLKGVTQKNEVYLTPKKGANRPTLHNRLYHHRPPGGFQNQTGKNLLTIPSLEITIIYHHIPSHTVI